MDFHILSVHTRDNKDDGTPLQFISGAQLAYYQAVEAAAMALVAAIAAAPRVEQDSPANPAAT